MPPTTPEPLLQGTLDLLILHALTAGPLHGHAIVRRLRDGSDDVVLVQEGSLYPALHRLEARGHVTAEWGLSENNRRARLYRLTRGGRKALHEERSSWERMSRAIDSLLATRGEPA
jgi:PadR family transcriptional regulator PadR